MQARCCFTVGAERTPLQLLHITGHMERLHVLDASDTPILTPAQERARGPPIGRACICVAGSLPLSISISDTLTAFNKE
jgi:hypothetical protein